MVYSASSGKVLANERAALRSERQVVAHVLVLNQRLGNLEGLDHRMQSGIAHRQAADRTRRRQVVLQQRRRDRQDARDVVEAFLIRVVGREQLRPSTSSPSRSRIAADVSPRD